MNLTSVINRDYSVHALAKSSVRIGTLFMRSPSGLTRGTLFLRPESMVGCYRHLRVAALRSGSSNLFQPAASRLEPLCGSDLTATTETIMTSLTILSKEIRQLDGLYSLNDLHKAAGGESKHQPSNFLRIETTRALIDEIQSSEMRSAQKTINGGIKRGTYVCKELVYAYAMWISPKFHLQVIRAFDQLYQQPALPSSEKKYSYPRKLLEQPGFMSGNNPAPLDPSMLANTKTFVSPLLGLLNELRADGHDVSAPWAEAIAMRDGITQMNDALEDICMKSLRASNKPASTQLKDAVRRKS